MIWIDSWAPHGGTVLRIGWTNTKRASCCERSVIKYFSNILRYHLSDALLKSPMMVHKCHSLIKYHSQYIQVIRLHQNRPIKSSFCLWTALCIKWSLSWSISHTRNHFFHCQSPNDTTLHCGTRDHHTNWLIHQSTTPTNKCTMRRAEPNTANFREGTGRKSEWLWSNTELWPCLSIDSIYFIWQTCELLPIDSRAVNNED